MTVTLTPSGESLNAKPVSIRVEPIPIDWDESLPVFARAEFLKAVGDEYGWLGGIDDSGALRCILPYTIIRKAGLRLVRFRVETILKEPALDVASERSFLDGVVTHFRRAGADIIIPGANNAIFRTYPHGAAAAPYGTHQIDLNLDEEELWRRLSKTLRYDIKAARKDTLIIREGLEFADVAWGLIRDTFLRSDMGFMNRQDFRRLVEGLNESGKVMVAEQGGIIESCCLFAFSRPYAYYIYAGNRHPAHPGANKVLVWQAMCTFRGLGVRRLDFVGARINPPKGSKQDSINSWKTRFGASLVQGYIWKHTLRPFRARIYHSAVRLLRGGDLVDQECHKLSAQARDITV